MKLFSHKHLYIALSSILFLLVFWPINRGKLPVPTDALVGLYHPWRDSLADKFPNGYPYKNPLITDSIRQQIPYRKLAIDQLKRGHLPKWNPYSFSGTPLLANIQTAAFYPLNFIFWLMPFNDAWTLLVVLQPVLAFIFTFWYLRNLKLDPAAAFLGGISFAFSGFMVAWLTWNTIDHVALWLPLALLANDKLVEKFSWKWILILIFAETAAFLAGHLQIVLYFFIFINIYLLARLWWKHGGNIYQISQQFLPFAIKSGLVLFFISIQLIPSIKFILVSAREFDLPPNLKLEWFLPYQHLIQFVAPDFFGNPATGNYFGKWNYGEFVGYIGLLPLLFGLICLFFRRDKKTVFFALAAIAGLLLATPNFIAKIPYLLNLPLVSSLQPTRILVIVCFSLAVLSALGLDFFLKSKLERKIFTRMLATGIVVISGWLMTLIMRDKSIGPVQIMIMQRNMILPTLIYTSFVIGVLTSYFRPKFTQWVILAFLVITIFDVYRFTSKFTSFSPQEFFFPQTATINFLQQNLGNYRFMTMDRRLLPANTSTYYKLASVDGYDPLYLLSYSQFVGAWTRATSDITPATFHRIITPESPNWVADLLGVKYILSLEDLTQPQYKLVFSEGQTKIYENVNVFPKAFLVEEVKSLPNKQAVADQMFADPTTLQRTAYVEKPLYIKPTPLTVNETAVVVSNTENEVVVLTKTDVTRLLVLTDIYYEDWQVFIDGQQSIIYPVDLLLRGVVVPQGEHQVVFRI